MHSRLNGRQFMAQELGQQESGEFNYSDCRFLNICRETLRQEQTDDSKDLESNATLTQAHDIIISPEPADHPSIKT